MINEAVYKLAKQIAHELFTDGNGKVADRLLLVDASVKGGSGLCEGAVADRIADAIQNGTPFEFSKATTRALEETTLATFQQLLQITAAEYGNRLVSANRTLDLLLLAGLEKRPARRRAKKR